MKQRRWLTEEERDAKLLTLAEDLGRFPTHRETRKKLGWSSEKTSEVRRRVAPNWAGPPATSTASGGGHPLQPRPERVLVISDLQIPFEDTMLVQKMLEWAATVRWDRAILNGDIMDFHKISRFAESKDYPLEDELTRGQVFVQQFVEAVRTLNAGCRVDYLEGNHEDRLRKYLATNADALRALRVDEEEVLSLQHLLGLRKLAVNWFRYQQVLKLPDGLYVEHGHRVSKHSAYTVKNLLTDLGASIIVGHTHRKGVHYRKDRLGLHRGYEGGCLCRLDPGYMPEESANWQQGWVVVNFFGDVWWVDDVLVQDGRFMIDGRVW